MTNSVVIFFPIVIYGIMFVKYFVKFQVPLSKNTREVITGTSPNSFFKMVA